MAVQNCECRKAVIAMENDTCFISFNSDISAVSIPEKFTFPFNYVPHQLTTIASEELQLDLVKNDQVITALSKGFGKMFGVLVVQNTQGELGYLRGFSGKINDTSILDGFVPPVYNRLTTDSFYSKDEAVLIKQTDEIEKLKASPVLAAQEKLVATLNENFERDWANWKSQIKADKQHRRLLRSNPNSSEEENEVLRRQSVDQQYGFKKFKRESKEIIQKETARLNEMREEIFELKRKRRKNSGILQGKLFEQFSFLNANNQRRNLLEIFEFTALKIPPAGAGDCAAPKMLQYAFAHNYTPIAMAEFWWGASPKMEIRKHGEYYPACRSKCEPILGHMLQGLEMDENPIYVQPTEHLKIGVLYEDEVMLVIDKPAGLLSVPGKEMKDSVSLRMKAKYPDSTGPLVAHRLDMSTSGIMLIAKTMETYTHLQKQFTSRFVKKRYQALLEGEVQEKTGAINLPLRVDLDNRPHQLVDYTNGKHARTLYEVVGYENGNTRIFFYPVTGRTHQLRVHAAHPDGINHPIIGDELYGHSGNRLHLHADKIEFKHPISGELMDFELAPEF